MKNRRRSSKDKLNPVDVKQRKMKKKLSTRRERIGAGEARAMIIG
jgi:hypothetical protein